jgi:hypothetical protein
VILDVATQQIRLDSLQPFLQTLTAASSRKVEWKDDLRDIRRIRGYHGPKQL